MAVVVLIGWIPVCALLFAFLRPVRAVTLAYLGGWLLLPMAVIPIQGFWDVDKTLATNAGVVAGAILFCSDSLKGYRVNFADVLLVAFAAGTCVTSVVNDLGIYDGFAAASRQLLYYAVPFWAGRVFVKDRQSLLSASKLIICAAALYALAATWEWRASPRIHRAIYGFFQHSIVQHYRWGFWRPIVCFPHALGLGVFFAWVSLLGLWLWRERRLISIFGVPGGCIVVLPVFGLLASMSFGPWAMFLAGGVLLLCWDRRWLRRAVLVPAVFSICWMGLRYAEWSNGVWLSSVAAHVSQDRADSLQYRIDAEELLIARAKERPVFGWGAWGRNRVKDERERDLVATDGLWVIILGCYGLVGLATFYLWLCWPLGMACRGNGEQVRDPAIMALLIAVGIQTTNLLFNGFLSPILIVMCGALVTLFQRSKLEARSTMRAARSGAPIHPPATALWHTG